MSRLRTLVGSGVAVVLACGACGGSSSHADSAAAGSSVTSDAGAGLGGSNAGRGGAPGELGGSAGVGGNAELGGSAGIVGSAGSAGTASSASGSSAGGGSGTGGTSAAGAPGSAGHAGALSGGASNWIIPETPGAAWSGPQDPACPSNAVSQDSDCTSPPGTRCSYAQDDAYSLRCLCYTSSTNKARWWCQPHWNMGWDSCPVAYPGNGTCPQLGDVTCYYVNSQGKLEACNCSANVSKCSIWGL